MKLLIYEARSRIGLSGKALAKKCGLSKSAMYRYENGIRSPTINQLEKIAKALGVKITDLFESDLK
jgi:transcriptional regulator with XRE-family HTH domain